MTPNRSMEISLELKKLMRTDLLKKLDEGFPFDIVESYENQLPAGSRRDRVYNLDNTVLTMLISAISEDKSLKQSVNIFKEVFEHKGQQMEMQEQDRLQQSKDLLSGERRKRGRPQLFKPQIQKSKTMEVSDNTAAYTKARGRIDRKLLDDIFSHTAEFGEYNGKSWHGMTVAITDGTYFQMQDTPELRSKYFVKEDDGAYPQGLLQGIIMQGGGQVIEFSIGTRHQSELELVKPMIERLNAGTLLLADDLYNTYAIFGLIRLQRCEIIVPGKRVRNFKEVSDISSGDQIVELTKTNRPKWVPEEQWDQFEDTMVMRRISYPSLEDEKVECILYTSITDPRITKEEIILKYTTRWDIEITIREIKTLMGMNIARSKSEEMVLKEITIALTAYNMIRKIVAQSVKSTDFSPKVNFIQKCFEADQELLIDKKGRIYNRWSPGRNAKATETYQKSTNPE